MNTEPQSELGTTESRPAWKRRICGTLAVLLLAVVWWIIWGSAPNVPKHPVAAQRGPDGQLIQVQNADDSGGVAARISTLKSNKSSTTTASTGSSGGAQLRASTAAVVVDTGEVLAERVAYELFQELKKTSSLDELRYLPPGNAWPDGERLPDLFIRVGIQSLSESGTVPYRSLQAKIAVRMVDQFCRSASYYNDHLTPAEIEFRWDTLVDYSATEIGIETAAARYEAVGRDIAGDLSKAITKQLGDWSKTHGIASEPPAEFLPAFQAAPEFAILTQLAAKRVVSGCDFMKCNVTVWKIPAAAASDDVLDQLGAGLRENGWDIPERSSDKPSRYLRTTRNQKTEIFEAFNERDFRGVGGEKPESSDWFAVYTHRMSEPDLTAALRAILERDVSERELIQFSRWWHLEPNGVTKYFEQHPPQLTPSLVYLARRAIHEQKLDDARRLVLRADALHRIIRHASSTSDEELKKLAKEAGIETLPKLPDLTALAGSDLVDLRDDDPLPSRRVRLDEPIIALISVTDAEQKFVCLTPIRRPGQRPEFTLKLQHVTLASGSSSWGETTTGDAARGEHLIPIPSDDGNVTLKVRSQKDADAFELQFDP